MRMLVDGMNMAKASYHVAKHLRTSTGVQAGTAFNFVGSLRKAIIRYKPNEVHVLWDSKPIWRTQIFDGYKASRVYAADDGEHNWGEQKELLQEVLQMLPVYHTEGSLLEADDLAWLMQDPGEMNILVSNDIDWCQLVSAVCKVYQTLKEDEVNPSNFEDKTGFKSVAEMLDCYSITGQKKDDIPGLEGVAKKGALAYIRGELSSSSTKSIKIKSWINNKETGFLRTRLLFDIKNCPPSLKEDIYSEKGNYSEDKYRAICERLEWVTTLNRYNSWIAPYLPLV